ncbi:MAG: SgcJ/EcaC family oxidoreductase [Candidatus Korobacteraceae bacterium]
MKQALIFWHTASLKRHSFVGGLPGARVWESQRQAGSRLAKAPTLVLSFQAEIPQYQGRLKQAKCPARFAQERRMLRNHLKAVLAVIVLVAISATASWAKGGEASTGEEAGIKKLVASFTECFNNKDADACAMLYTEDGDFTNLRGDADHGRPAVKNHYEKVLSTTLKNAQRKDWVRSITPLGPKYASVDIDFEMTGATPPVRKGLLTWIVEKQGNGWRIRLFHEFDYPAK